MAKRHAVLDSLEATFGDLRIRKLVAERLRVDSWKVALEQLDIDAAGRTQVVGAVGEGTTLRQAMGRALDRRFPGAAS